MKLLFAASSSQATALAASVYWTTYDDAGEQQWFVGIGQVEGTALVIAELVRTQGSMFGQAFDQSSIQLSVAGSLCFEIGGCDSGRLRYQIDGEQGTLTLSRLSAGSTLACTA